MRIRYTGQDGRTRVAEANRVKFMPEGFRATDKQAEYDEHMRGPAIVAHVYRYKGGKRLTLQAPEGFDMAAAELQLLQNGWLDLTSCTVLLESFY